MQPFMRQAAPDCLSRHYPICIVILLLSVLVLPRVTHAGGTVTNCANDIQLTSMISGGGLVTFNCGGTGSSAIISINASITITAGLNVHIDGNENITLSGNHVRRMFDVASGGTLALSNITLRDGRDFGGGAIQNSGTVTITNSILTANEASGQFGGAIKNIGTLTITSSILSNNTATAGYGGAIDASETTTLTTIRTSVFEENSAKLGGGAIANNGTVILSDTTFANNSTESSGGISGGGAIETTGPLTIQTSVFYGNSAGKGGALYNEGGVVKILNSTISGNMANTSPFSGGGLHNESSGQATIVASTIVNNSAPTGIGGNLRNGTGQNVVTIRQSIVAGGNPTNCMGSLISAGNNLESGQECGFSLPTDQRNTLPQLGALANNGGITLSHALTAGSPAIDAVASGACLDLNNAPLTTDQRGTLRPIDGNGNGIAQCDTGAYEANQTTSTATPTLTPTRTPGTPTATPVSRRFLPLLRH